MPQFDLIGKPVFDVLLVMISISILRLCILYFGLDCQSNWKKVTELLIKKYNVHFPIKILFFKVIDTTRPVTHCLRLWVIWQGRWIIPYVTGKIVKFCYRALGRSWSRCAIWQVTWIHPGGRLWLLSTRPAVTFPAEERHRPSTSTKLYCLLTEAQRWCEQLASSAALL